MSEPGDDRIEAAFEALRTEDRYRAPEFRRTLLPRHRARFPRFVQVAAVSVVLLIGWAGFRAMTRESVPEFTMGSLRMPTDFLLDLPGSTLVTTMPAIGRTDDWFPGAPGMKGTS